MEYIKTFEEFLNEAKKNKADVANILKSLDEFASSLVKIDATLEVLCDDEEELQAAREEICDNILPKIIVQLAELITAENKDKIKEFMKYMKKDFVENAIAQGFETAARGMATTLAKLMEAEDYKPSKSERIDEDSEVNKFIAIGKENLQKAIKALKDFAVSSIERIIKNTV